MGKNKQYTVRLERDVNDHILPKGFLSIFFRRFLPIASLTYIASIIGVAGSKSDIIYYLFKDTTAYIVALFIALWVSIPAIIWILLKGSPLLAHTANLWYIILAAIMVITITLSFLLFPEVYIYGLKLYFISSAPVFIMIYLLLVKEYFPTIIALPLNIMGALALLYGALVNVIF